MPINIKKYYTYQDEFPEQGVTKEFCHLIIKQILTSYTKESVFKAINYFAQCIGLGNDFHQIQIYQQRVFGIPSTRTPIIIHRQAVCVIFQFLFSLRDEEFGTLTEVTNKDIFFLFILANQLTDFTESETLSIKKSIRKKNFFANIKEIHYTNNKDDLQAGFYLFKKYYRKIVGLNKAAYNEVIKQKFGIEIDDYIKILNLIEQQNYPEVFSLFDKYAVINFEDTYSIWESREPKYDIPREFPFIQKYPIIKIGSEYLISDLHSLCKASEGKGIF